MERSAVVVEGLEMEVKVHVTAPISLLPLLLTLDFKG